LRKLRRLLSYLTLPVVWLLVLHYSVGWSWSTAATVVLMAAVLLVAAHQVIVKMIEERIGRWAWPRRSEDETLEPPPQVPAPRVWTFSFRWAVPCVVDLVQSRGFRTVAPRRRRDAVHLLRALA
jgi:hypothetical protein